MYLKCDKGLVTNYGVVGATQRDGGHMKFYPYKKGGGGGTNSFGVVFTQ